MKLEVIKVKNDKAKNGFMLINKSDFNEKEHKLYSEEKPKPKRKPRAKKAD